MLTFTVIAFAERCSAEARVEGASVIADLDCGARYRAQDSGYEEGHGRVNEEIMARILNSRCRCPAEKGSLKSANTFRPRVNSTLRHCYKSR